MNPLIGCPSDSFHNFPILMLSALTQLPFSWLEWPTIPFGFWPALASVCGK